MGPKIGFMHLKAPFLILLGAHSMLVGLGCAQQSELTLADPHTFPSHGEGFASFIDTASVVSSKVCIQTSHPSVAYCSPGAGLASILRSR